MSTEELKSKFVKTIAEKINKNTNAAWSLKGMDTDVLDNPALKKAARPAHKNAEITKADIERVLRANAKAYDFRFTIKEYESKGEKNYPTIDADILKRFGLAIGSCEFKTHNRVEALKPGDTFLLAIDVGATSQMVAENLAQGLSMTGVNVVMLGVCTSAELYNDIQRFNAQGGLMVTRSHVPSQFNGFKLMIGVSTLFEDADIEKHNTKIIDRIIKNEFRIMNNPSDYGTMIPYFHLRGGSMVKVEDVSLEVQKGEYIKRYGLFTKDDFPVAVCYNYGTAVRYKECLNEIFGKNVVKEFRGEVMAEPPVLPDPTKKENLIEIIKWSAENPKVPVFAFDLDSDRISIVINGILYAGAIMHFPLLEVILSQDEHKGDNVLYDPRRTKAFKEMVLHLGGKIQRQEIGHSKVKKSIDIAMKKLANQKGYASIKEFVQKTGYYSVEIEDSAHMFITNEYGIPVDDGIEYMFWWIRGMQKLRKKYNNPDMMIADYIKMCLKKRIINKYIIPQEMRTPFDGNYKKMIAEAVYKYFNYKYGQNPPQPPFKKGGRGGIDRQGYEVYLIGDGFRLDTPYGFVMYRYSNTEPVLSMKFEGLVEDENDPERYIREEIEEVFAVHWAFVKLMIDKGINLSADSRSIDYIKNTSYEKILGEEKKIEDIQPIKLTEREKAYVSNG